MAGGLERQESTITQKKAAIKIITLFVEGIPRSKLRPRTVVNRTNKRGKPWTYNPSVTTEYADYVRVKAREYMKTRELKPFPRNVPVHACFTFYVKRLIDKNGDLARPDTANLICNVQDALSGEMYIDDAQITQIVADKVKATNKDKVGVLIEVKKAGG